MTVLFHIGYPKCGSTSLQHYLFAADRRKFRGRVLPASPAALTAREEAEFEDYYADDNACLAELVPEVSQLL